MMKEDYLYGKGILIEFNGKTKRKEAEFVDVSSLKEDLTISKDPFVKDRD